MQLNNESILVQARDQPPTQQVPPQSLFPVPKAPAIGFAGSAPKAGANPSLRETNTVTGAKHRDFNENHSLGGGGGMPLQTASSPGCCYARGPTGRGAEPRDPVTDAGGSQRKASS